jgi:hypothetical protein
MLAISGADPRPSIPGSRRALDRIKLQGHHERGWFWTVKSSSPITPQLVRPLFVKPPQRR